MKIRDFINKLPMSSVMVRRNSREAVAEFLRKVRPVATNRPLVRVGPEYDGGYLAPDDFEGVDGCFSPGVDRTAGFELEMAGRGIPCFLADYSVEAAPVKHPLFAFEKKYLGTTNDEVHVTLDDWVNRNAPSANDLILQMDIEGAEYPVFLDARPETLRKFRIMIVEFHNLDDLWHEKGLQMIGLTFEKLRRDFEIVHIHPNNVNRPVSHDGLDIPPLMEFAFLRKDRVTRKEFATQFPHPLDRTNVGNKPDYPLPKCWWGGR